MTTSRGEIKPQAVQTCSLSESSPFAPHVHVWLVPQGLTVFNTRPALSALYASLEKKADQLTSCTDLASIPPAKPLTFRFSTAITPKFWTSQNVSLCWNSCLWFLIR